MTVNERIKELRIRMGLTQDELANRAGYTNSSTISKIEKGSVFPPQDRILALAKALDVSPVTLLGLDDVEDPQPSFDPYYIVWDAIAFMKAQGYVILQGWNPAEEALSDLSDVPVPELPHVWDVTNTEACRRYTMDEASMSEAANLMGLVGKTLFAENSNKDYRSILSSLKYLSDPELAFLAKQLSAFSRSDHDGQN